VSNIIIIIIISIIIITATTIMDAFKIKADKDLDALLAGELHGLSLNDRNSVQEEIHCVRSLALEETPDMVAEALHRLRERALIASIPGVKTTAYQQALGMGSPFIQSPDFGIKYLRSAFFNVEEAAAKMVNHLEIQFKLFGAVVLERPLRYSDLNEEDRSCLRTGGHQILPSRDKFGRMVMVFQGDVRNLISSEGVRVETTIVLTCERTSMAQTNDFLSFSPFTEGDGLHSLRHLRR
jgi:hypothetical protein